MMARTKKDLETLAPKRTSNYSRILEAVWRGVAAMTTYLLGYSQLFSVAWMITPPHPQCSQGAVQEGRSGRAEHGQGGSPLIMNRP